MMIFKIGTYLFATFLDSIFGGLGTVDLLEGLRDEPSPTLSLLLLPKLSTMRKTEKRRK